MNTERQPSIQLSPRGGKGDLPLSLWERVGVRVALARAMPPAAENFACGVIFFLSEATA
jgi:hypothetical protein